MYKAAFGPRYPLPPKVASPSWQVTEPPNLDSYATSPKYEHKAGTSSTETQDDDSVGALRQPGFTDLEKNGPESVTTHHGEIANLHEPSTAPSALSVTPLPTISRRSESTVVDTAVKWSDVVALGSKALQLKNTSSAPEGKAVSKSLTQPENTSSDSQGISISESKAENTPGVVVSFSILHAMMKVTDIFDVLMLNCPDFLTLFSLVVSCKSAERTFQDHSQGIIKAMLERMPEELQHMTVALIAFNNSPTRNPNSIKWLMQTWLTIEPMPVMDQFANPLHTLRNLARVFSAIDLFTDVIANNCVDNLKDYKTVVASRNGLDYRTVTQWSNKHPLLDQTEWSDIPDDTEWEVADLPDDVQEIDHPLSEREKYRIKRALLRYELFCSLFRLRPDKYFDTRHHPHRYNHIPDASVRRVFLDEQRLFFQKYVNPWEVGEMANITQFVFDVVRNSFFHKYKSMRYDEAYKSWYTPYYNKHHGKNRHDDHEVVVDEFHNHIVWYTSQGLSTIRGIYEDRKEEYNTLTEKYGSPRYQIADFFLPFAKIAQRGPQAVTNPSPPSWVPRHEWRDTPGMELPSKGWIDKNPADDDPYWGEKWMRKIGYFIWDRD